MSVSAYRISVECIPNFFLTGFTPFRKFRWWAKTEEALTADRVPYEVGIARYSELAKSLMLGDEAGMLKLMFQLRHLRPQYFSLEISAT